MGNELPAINPFELAEVIYYSAVIAAAILSSTFQTIRSNDYRGIRYVIGSGMVSGLLAFSIVTFIDGDLGDRTDDRFFYLGISVAIGLTVEWQQDLIKIMFLVIVQMMRSSLKRVFNVDLDEINFGEDRDKIPKDEPFPKNDISVRNDPVDHSGNSDFGTKFDNKRPRPED